MWYLIVSIPDLCTLTYFEDKRFLNYVFMEVKCKRLQNDLANLKNIYNFIYSRLSTHKFKSLHAFLFTACFEGLHLSVA